MYHLSYLIKCIMYIKDKLSVIERVFLRKIYKETCFSFFVFFLRSLFLGQNAPYGKNFVVFLRI